MVCSSWCKLWVLQMFVSSTIVTSFGCSLDFIHFRSPFCSFENNKKRIDLIYTTTDNSPHSHLDSRSPGNHLECRSPGNHHECKTPENHLECRSTENCKKPTIEQNKLFLRSKLQNGDLKCSRWLPGDLHSRWLPGDLLSRWLCGELSVVV
jgi:hypothetical protein